MTPADELHAAADKLQSLIIFLGDNRGPWYVDTPESGYPQTINNRGVPYLVANTYEGPQIPVFTIAPYIAAMHPGVGKALTGWLTAAADHCRADYLCCDNGPCSEIAAPALAVARQLLGSAA
jgi:hypothetical protein